MQADHTVFIVHSFTNVQNKNQTIKGKTSEQELLLSGLFLSLCPQATALLHRATHSLSFEGSE